MSKRIHLVKTAGFWFNSADRVDQSEKYLSYVQAYNHVENALASALEVIKKCATTDDSGKAAREFLEQFEKHNS